MIQVMRGFFKGLGTLARPWWVWVGLLMVANMVLPLYFIGTAEGKVVLAAFFLAGGLQMAIFRVKGFVRLLGLGHIVPWVPLLIWLGGRLDGAGLDTSLGLWLRALILLDGISLLIDFVDVGRYLLGARTSSYVLHGG